MSSSVHVTILMTRAFVSASFMVTRSLSPQTERRARKSATTTMMTGIISIASNSM